MNEYWGEGHAKQCSGCQRVPEVPVPVSAPDVPIPAVPVSEHTFEVADVTPKSVPIQESPLRVSQRLLEKASTL